MCLYGALLNLFSARRAEAVAYRKSFSAVCAESLCIVYGGVSGLGGGLSCLRGSCRGKCNSKIFVMTKGLFTGRAIDKSVCKPGTEIKLVILILNDGVALGACLLICKTAVPSGSLICHNKYIPFVC